MFERWVTSKATLADVAAAAGVTRDTARLWFVPLWERLPRMSGHVSCRTIVVDGVTVVRREAVALLASDSETSKPAGCVFAEQECHGAWREFFLELRRRGANPKFLVCDGQKGLLKARREVWPDALVQRCVVHVHRQAMAWLTKNPKTDAGRELRPIVSMLLLVCTPAQRDSWLASLREWEGPLRVPQGAHVWRERLVVHAPHAACGQVTAPKRRAGHVSLHRRSDRAEDVKPRRRRSQ